MKPACCETHVRCAAGAGAYLRSSMREPAWSRRFWWLGRSRSYPSCSSLQAPSFSKSRHQLGSCVGHNETCMTL